jgi:signal transduction histidine kinase
MRERVESIGGELQIVSEPGTGTRIDAILPLPHPAPSLNAESSRGAESESHAAVA